MYVMVPGTVCLIRYLLPKMLGVGIILRNIIRYGNDSPKHLYKRD